MSVALWLGRYINGVNTILTVLATFLVVFSGCYTTYSMLHPNLDFLETFFGGCHEPDDTYRVYQYGDFWVMQNVLGSQLRKLSCDADFTFIMQGTFADLYLLDHLYSPSLRAHISFAVYVPNFEYFKYSMMAIKYVEECTVNRKDLRSHAAYHLYFRFAILNDIVKYATDMNKVPCKDLKFTKYPTSVKVPVALLDHAKTVGLNIAQRAVYTRFVMPAESYAFPTTQLSRPILETLNQLMPNVEKSFVKTIFGVPSIYVKNMTWSDQYMKTASDIHAALEANPERFIMLQTPPTNGKGMTRYKLRNLMNSIVHMPMFAIADINAFPLMPEHFGLTNRQSEIIRLFHMALLNYEIIMLEDAYTMCVFNTKVYAHFQHKVLISDDIKQQYKILYSLE